MATNQSNLMWIGTDLDEIQFDIFEEEKNIKFNEQLLMDLSNWQETFCSKTICEIWTIDINE